MTNKNIRQILHSDIHSVLKIINYYDEDDAEQAENQIFNDNMVHFVYETDNQIVGISGYERVLDTDRTAYLSWTYVEHSYIKNGIGTELIRHTIESAAKEGCRCMFIKLSDYREEGATYSIYNSARRIYLKEGFKSYIIFNDYYQNGENLEILGKRLSPELLEKPLIKDEKPTMRFNGISLVNETVSTYTFNWYVPNRFNIFEKRIFSVHDIEVGIKSAIGLGATSIVLSFPSNLPLIHEPLFNTNFKLLGKLEDYYEDGLDELHFILKL